ncbi:M3 family metallopeptidase [Spongisporangium articulatum]|uniref:M3 family metallopeptidase n=1 Tax=Spongisporangium articulatum TaxID=3362603 RepID=A0ABW8AH06_9ACTN
MPVGNPFDGDSPFARTSDLPYGLPPFDRIGSGDYRPAFAAGIAQHRAEIAAIGGEPVTFENTMEPLERAGTLLARVEGVFENLISTDSSDELRAVEAEVLPQLTAHFDAVLTDQALFARVAALHAAPEASWTTEQVRLVRRWYLDMQRAGAGLDAAGRARLAEINAELSVLGSDFRNKLQADTNALAVHVTDVGELDGLPEDAIAAARSSAVDRGLDGYVLTLSLFTAQPATASLTNRDLRRRVFEASVSRGGRGNEHDTRATLTRTVALRAERARLLGYRHHADYVVADQTAPSVEDVMTTLQAMVTPAMDNARAERDALTDLLHADGHDGPLQPWDWPYYARILAEQRFSIDTAGLRPWFELNRVLHDGVFAAATGLYGLTFERRPDLRGYHPDVDVYEVFDETGAGIALFLVDWYARPSKRGGAWMNTFVDQSHLLGTRPVATLNLNIPRPPTGSPTLLTLDELNTTFHEFGHVLHGVLSDVTYRRLSGTSVPRDVVEFPSQVNEMWSLWPALANSYARHHETGEPLPEGVLDALVAAEQAGQAFATTEILGAMLLDQAWHQRTVDDDPIGPDDVAAFEAESLAAYGVCLPELPPRYGSTYFAHIFAGGYSAGYYSYIWSEVLDADTVDWFVENGGLRRELGAKFAAELLSRGGAVDPMEAFAAVRGRPPRIEPLLERRGLTSP